MCYCIKYFLFWQLSKASIHLKGEIKMDIKETIDLLVKRAKTATDNVTIIFLANVNGMTSNDFDYPDLSILTEFLTMEEYEELLISLQEFGFYVVTYFEYKNFIYDYLNGKFEATQIVIFEGTQKGTGKARDAFFPTFCDLEGLLHTGPNAYVNSICTNKYHWTKILQAHNISVPNSWQYFNGTWTNNQSPDGNKKLIAKPCYECASIGIHKESVAEYSFEYEQYVNKLSVIYKQPFIVQEFIKGYEVDVPVIIHQNCPYILPPMAIGIANNPEMGSDFLDFDTVYDDNYQFTPFNEINNSLCTEIQEQALKIIDILGLERYTRIDFRVDTNGNSYVTDINSYPHIVQHSAFAYSFKQLNIKPNNVLPALIGNVLNEII